MRARWPAGLALLVVALAALTGVAAGAVGGVIPKAGLDSSYGEHGVATIPLPVAVPAAEEERAGEAGETRGPYVEADFFAAAEDGSAYVIGALGGCGKLCTNGRYLSRLDPGGDLDRSFADGGRLDLPTEGKRSTAMADSAGRVLVAYRDGADVIVRRFTQEGKPDPSFGRAGVVKLACGCAKGFVQLRLLRSPGGSILVDVNGPFVGNQTRMQLTRLRADGRADRRFGDAGTVGFKSPEVPSGVAVAPGGAVLLGGTTCCGARRIYVERVTASGRLDRRFDRVARSSMRRLARLGEFPKLTAVVPRPGGGLVAIGSSQRRQGFYLRLHPDGRLVRNFGHRGLTRLPFLVDSAAAGIGGAIFVVGEPPPYGRYHAYRVLANGHPDPAYNGADGIVVPLSGVPARVAPVGGGKVLVTDKGDFECIRECSRPEPAIARFNE